MIDYAGLLTVLAIVLPASELAFYPEKTNNNGLSAWLDADINGPHQLGLFYEPLVRRTCR